MSGRDRMQKLSFVSRAGAGLVLFALAAACNSPTRPGRNVPDASRTQLEIVGTTSVAPQQSTAFQAFMVAANGTRQDVTARVTWTTSDPGVLSVSSGGSVTGGAVGEAALRAILEDLSASTTVIVVPAGTFRVAGIVTASGSALAGAQVQLITASGDVLTTRTAGPAGFRFYGVAGRARLRISRSAFHPAEAEIDIQDHLTHDVSLSAIDLSGTYTLTLSASSRCRLELPEALRTRTYTATIAQQGGSLMVTLHGPSFFPGYDDRFAGEFGEANQVTFEVGGVIEWEPPVEVVPSGRMTTTIFEKGLSGFLNGELKVTDRSNRDWRIFTCTAPDHGVEFSR